MPTKQERKVTVSGEWFIWPLGFLSTGNSDSNVMRW